MSSRRETTAPSAGGFAGSTSSLPGANNSNFSPGSSVSSATNRSSRNDPYARADRPFGWYDANESEIMAVALPTPRSDGIPVSSPAQPYPASSATSSRMVGWSTGSISGFQPMSLGFNELDGDDTADGSVSDFLSPRSSSLDASSTRGGSSGTVNTGGQNQSRLAPVQPRYVKASMKPIRKYVLDGVFHTSLGSNPTVKFVRYSALNTFEDFSQLPKRQTDETTIAGLSPVFCGQLRYRMPGQHLLEVIRDVVGVSPAIAQRHGAGCALLHCTSPADVEKLLSWNDRILLDLSGYWVDDHPGVLMAYCAKEANHEQLKAEGLPRAPLSFRF